MPYMLIVFFSMSAPAVTIPFANESLCDHALIEVLKSARQRTTLTAPPTAICVKVQ